MAKKTKPKGVAYYKKQADKYFSTYVRMRDGDDNGIVECITCDKQAHYKSMQAGHFVSRKVSLLRYEEENVNGQCVGCNMFKSGEQYAYSKALDLKYGKGTADKLWAQKDTTHKFTTTELQSIIDDAKAQIKWMESNGNDS